MTSAFVIPDFGPPLPLRLKGPEGWSRPNPDKFEVFFLMHNAGDRSSWCALRLPDRVIRNSAQRDQCPAGFAVHPLAVSPESDLAHAPQRRWFDDRDRAMTKFDGPLCCKGLQDRAQDTARNVGNSGKLALSDIEDARFVGQGP